MGVLINLTWGLHEKAKKIFPSTRKENFSREGGGL
jgi:hypothetical protein